MEKCLGLVRETFVGLSTVRDLEGQDEPCLRLELRWAKLMGSRAHDENDCVHGHLSICISIFRGMRADRMFMYLPQVGERGGGMQALERSVR